MDTFSNLQNDFALEIALAVQGILVIFFIISPLMGKLIHQGVAKFSSLVLIVCSMFIVGNLTYMGMVYGVYRLVPDGTIHPLLWITLSFFVAFSLSILVGRYLNWYFSDNFNPAVWVQEYEELTDADMMPFDRRRKREMERRKRSRHDI